MDCPAYFIPTFLFYSLVPRLSVTPGRLAHAYIFIYGLILRFPETSIHFSCASILLPKIL